jgi:hypothetical protein
MACPKLEIVGKTVILVSGYRRVPTKGPREARQIQVEAIEMLRQSARKNPDAVAFGYTGHKWIPAA